MAAGKPLDRQRRPFQRVGHDQVVQERGVLLPDLVLLVYQLLIGSRNVGSRERRLGAGGGAVGGFGAAGHGFDLGDLLLAWIGFGAQTTGGAPEPE